MSLPEPRGRQSDVIYLPGAGHQVVLGTAGTGKTTMAMLRAEHLAAPETRNSGRVLLVTYNNALVTYLRHIQPAAAANITIETYGLFARGYLNSVGKMPYGAIANPELRRHLAGQAIKEIAATYKPGQFFERPVEFFLDEIEWISGMGLQALSDYLAAERVGRGRGAGLNDSQREAIWKIRTAYLKLRSDHGKTYDWWDLPGAVRASLPQDSRPRRYRHVVIDEGQDLAPEAIRSLAATVPADGSVTFFGDYHQLIYGQGVSWRSCGLNIHRVERFSDNYRNTAQIARLAIAMSRMPHMAGDPQDLVEPREPTAAGTLPTLVTCSDPEREIQLIGAQARDYARTGTVAVLARTWADARQACVGLPVRELDPEMRVWDPTPGIWCGAYHSAKGLEFDTVILPFLDAAHMPNPDKVAAFGERDAEAREARLLYVAITRARSDLLLTHRGPLTPLLPTDPALYTRLAV
ncbi:3'-5' exonuclease [Actinomadura rupiterrae]|uniref:3'-5' exonuclease n=1 Tax=Actinomadura rupiterrae TaxID=559627 RepID=UPI0020A4B3C6|nr:3'-5' exonuclease [Actinomadura rupiterrae]MCP2340663.1 superfamily I DNA/RNA helicase [Actinomadura rupiterrae]